MISDRFPRLRVAHLPTPLEPLDRFSALLGGPRIWIKRDDCTGLATGGNKVRKLEFLLADALRAKADVVITTGAVQSNHVRQTAAFCAKLGLELVALLEDRGANDPTFKRSGNLFLDRLFAAQTRIVPAGTDMRALSTTTAEELRAAGRRPYVIPTGGSNSIGALGYVEAAAELLDQAAAMNLTIDEIVHPTGSGGTQAGLLLGLAARKHLVPVLGVSVGKPRQELEAIVLAIAQETAANALPEVTVDPQTVHVDSDYVGDGYGLPTEAMAEAVKLVARCEGLLLDPVYTGKAMAGLIAKIRAGRHAASRNIVFWHTGGSAGLFAYPAALGLTAEAEETGTAALGAP